jgi:hypothetical protein
MKTPAKKIYGLQKECLTDKELSNFIVSKVGLINSSSSKFKHYKIYFNCDYEFEEQTFINEEQVYVTKGKYEIISKEGVGYIMLYYHNDVYPSDDLESLYNVNNPKSVFKTHKVIIGRFQIINDTRAGKVLLYENENNELRTIIMFTENHTCYKCNK